MDFSEFGENLKFIEYKESTKSQSETDTDNEVINYLRKGKFEDTDFGIGDNIYTVISNLGDPNSAGSFQCSNYYSYNLNGFYEVYYIFDDIDEFGSTIISVGISEKSEIYPGLEIGMDIEEFDFLIGDFKTSQGFNDESGFYEVLYKIDDYMILYLELDDNQKNVTKAELSIKD
jgi:hypothetical protein